MRLSLRTLVTDLAIRADVALAGLADAPHLDGRTTEARERVEHIRWEVGRLLEEDLGESSEKFYPAYQRLTQSMFELETFELPFILHHDQAAARATRLCSALLENVDWKYGNLLVSTFSTEYYSTHAKWRVIALPPGEERRLLGIPDLCHELGHTVYSDDSEELVGDFLPVLQRHLMGRGDANSAGENDPTDVYLSWLGTWLQEFACDLVATYLVGPAFPRQHARLRAMRQPPWPVYELKLYSTHPADHARMQACLHLVDSFGFDSHTAELHEVWNEIVDASGETMPDEYELFYAPELLRTLADTVAAGCEKLNLRRYDPDADPETDIPRLTNEAWDRIESGPDAYAEWEEEALRRLWAHWRLN